GQTGVKSIEKIFFMSILVRRKREHRIHQVVISETVTRLDRPSSSSLRKLVPQAFHSELHIGHAEHGIHDSRIQFDRIVFCGTGHRSEAANIADIQLLDRKSTRLNSSHVAISYAVF